MTFSIVSHDATWKHRFIVESGNIGEALGRNVVAIHHIGSTAIPRILAKPIIDILVEVSRIDDVDDHAESMSQLGYESLGENGIKGRRYFRKAGSDGRRVVHAHVFDSNSDLVSRHIAFRDFLLSHPDRAQEYSDLKARLIASGVTTSGEYQSLKAPFVKTLVRDAVKWSSSRS